MPTLRENCHDNITFQNCLQWGRSNFVDPVEWPKIRLLSRDFGTILLILAQRKTAEYRVHYIFFSPDPRDLLNLIFRDWPRSGEF